MTFISVRRSMGPWCFVFHAWTRWKDNVYGPILRSEDKTEIGSYVTQQRECGRCGMKQLRTVRTRVSF